MMPGKTKAWIDAFIHGKYSFVADGKPVYPEYNDEVHVAKTELEWRAGLPLYLGMDFGLTPCTRHRPAHPRPAPVAGARRNHVGRTWGRSGSPSTRWST
jgi:hypothetical protein